MIYVYKLVQIDTKKLLFCVTKNCDLGQKRFHFSEKGLGADIVSLKCLLDSISQYFFQYYMDLHFKGINPYCNDVHT